MVKKFLLSMERVCKYGSMVQNMMVTGEMEWRRAKEISIMQTEMFIQENFTRTAQMALEFMFIKMVKLMKASGVMICRMAQARKNSRMVQNMTECLRMVKNGDKELTNGLTSQFIPVTG